jgi:hypothetical protein
MEKVQKPSNSECYTPSSEPFRIYMKIIIYTASEAWIVREQIQTNQKYVFI